MKSPRRILFLLLVILATAGQSLWAQDFTVSGKVTDAQNRQPLAFVNIVVNDGLIGTMSDIDGRYEISANEPIVTVSFSSVGYEPATLTLQSGQKKCNASLKPVTFELGEVTVEAGENPAHRIIDSLMGHRTANNPNSLESYRYHIYDKMIFTIDSSNFGKALAIDTIETTNLRMFDSILQKSDLMVMETASEVLFKAPDRKLQNVLGTKIAGMKDPTFIYLVNSMQSISFYDEVINVAGTDFVNPISRGSKSSYFFTLETVSPIGQGDSLYVVSFHPMHGSTFNGLRGTMTINSDGWALQSVKAEPDEQGAVYTIDIQQLYQKVENQWFPKQLNTNLKFPSIMVNIDGQVFPMVAIGKSYLDEIEINPDLSEQRFSSLEVVVDPDAAYRDDTFWNQHRIDSLTERVKATYILVDSITEGSDIFDRVLGMTDKLMNESALPLGGVNLELGNLLKVSASRGWHFGLGISTNDRFSRHIRLNAFGGYWTKINKFDYGGGVKWLINRQRQMELGLRFYNRSATMGEFSSFGDEGGLLSESSYKYTFYENVYVRKNAVELQFSSRFANYFKGYLNLSANHMRYSDQFQPIPSEALTRSLFYNAEIKLRFAYKEKLLSKPNGIQSLGTTYPIVWLSYMHSFPIMGGQYEFDRFKFEVSKNFYTRYMGVSKIVLQAGYATEGCPIEETFDIIGTYEPFGLYSPASFSTMRFDEFFCDRFAALYLSHNFSGMLWKTESEWFKPQLTLVTNIGWGDMPRAHAYPDKNFKTMEKGYFESGVVVKGLLNALWAKVGLGVFYRYGPNSLPNVWDNFAWKWSATFEL